MISTRVPHRPCIERQLPTDSRNACALSILRDLAILAVPSSPCHHRRAIIAAPRALSPFFYLTTGRRL